MTWRTIPARPYQEDRLAIEETLNGSITDVGDAIAQKEEVMVQLDATEESLAAAEMARDSAIAEVTDARTAVREVKERAEDTAARLEDAEANMDLLREAGHGGCVLPRHPMHFEPSSLELNCFL
jgi:chromosome segregation ATPase